MKISRADFQRPVPIPVLKSISGASDKMPGVKGIEMELDEKAGWLSITVIDHNPARVHPVTLVPVSNLVFVQAVPAAPVKK